MKAAIILILGCAGTAVLTYLSYRFALAASDISFLGFWNAIVSLAFLFAGAVFGVISIVTAANNLPEKK